MHGMKFAPLFTRVAAAHLVAGALLLSPSAQGTSAPFASKELQTLDRETTQHVTRLLEEQIQDTMNTQTPQGARLRSITISPSDAIVRLDISKSYLPANVSYMGAELEDRLSELQNVVLGIIENELGYRVSQVLFLFDGRPLEFYYPNDFPSQSGSSKAIGAIVVSAGHGAYLHHYSTPAWIFQRDVHHGVLEDQITQTLASQLAALLVSRSGAMTTFVRSLDNAAHTPSSLPWSDISARYFLAESYPIRPDIWNSLPNSTAPDRERSEDIRARPFYANDLNAEALLSIHTNADSTGTARGTRIYHHPGRSADVAMASSMLCYMREVIQAQPGYEDFPVASAPHAQSNHGENSHSQVPSVIVETAFHSNAADAAALLDPVFQDAAMKGVEKGYRLNKQGEPCTPYTITDVPDISAPWGGTPYIEVFFEGFPQYPVDITVENISCGTICTPADGTIYSEYPSPLPLGFTCDGDPDSPPAGARWRVTLKDADGVNTSFDYNTMCGGTLAGQHPEEYKFLSIPVRTSVSASR